MGQQQRAYTRPRRRRWQSTKSAHLFRWCPIALRSRRRSHPVLMSKYFLGCSGMLRRHTARLGFRPVESCSRKSRVCMLPESVMKLNRRTFLQLMGLGATASTGLLGGCDSVGSVFGRMFAVPPRDTNYFTPNDQFYVVNYMDSPFNLSRDLDQEQWRLSITGEVRNKAKLGWRDILNRDSFDQVVTLECIDTLPG